MFPHSLATFVVGLLALASAWLPVLLRRSPVTLPIVAVLFGAALYLAAGRPDLAPFRPLWETVTEYVLVIAVMGAGLKIDRPFRPGTWTSTWRLLAFAMPISIALTALGAWWILGMPVMLALLAAAILSPTDPVLASDLQVGPPGEGEEGEVRFALTSEAGLNDGVAMPFVLLAMTLLGGQEAGPGTLLHWLGAELVWHVAIGVALGAGFGWSLVRLDHRLPERLQLRASQDGLAVLGVSLLVYGIAEFIHANGFVAVFAAAVASRNAAPETPDFARTLHGFADQLERFAMVMLMSLFGALVLGSVWPHLRAVDGVFVAAVLFVVRPVAVLLSFLGSRVAWPTRLVLGFFGIRGLGSLFYLYFALARVETGDADRLQAIVGLTVLLSVAVYGLTAMPIMKRVDRRRERRGAVYDGPVLGQDGAGEGARTDAPGGRT